MGNRSAQSSCPHRHLAASELPWPRSAADAIHVLCDYGFQVLGLHRLQIDTLADNAPMIRAAATVGFVAEGTLRHSAWVNGDFADQVILGLLATD
jgi:RimJ/RimL family protein N-acetyltransferase